MESKNPRLKKSKIAWDILNFRKRLARFVIKDTAIIINTNEGIKKHKILGVIHKGPTVIIKRSIKKILSSDLTTRYRRFSGAKTESFKF